MSRTFDRRVEFDDRSRRFPIRALVTGKTPRSYTWRCSTFLDQGSEGACVGFSWSHELAARPHEWPVTNRFAQQLYEQARRLDEWEGEDYDGTSVLAGAKAAKAGGFIGAYRWAFSIDDLILAVGYQGPAILGINWYEGMLDTDSSGWVQPEGEVVGGHAILCRGVSLNQGYFTLRNSWGSSWGLGGDCRIGISALAKVLADQGEACIPELRASVQ